MTQYQYDATNKPGMRERALLPPGWYNAQMTNQEGKTSQSNSANGLLNCEYTILDGPYAGAKVYDNLNLWNQSPKAVEIAQQTVASICHAIGIGGITDTTQLMSAPFAIKVGIERDPTGQYADKNTLDNIKEYGYSEPDLAATPGGPVTVQAAPQTQAAPQAQAQAAPPPQVQAAPPAAVAPPPVATAAPPPQVQAAPMPTTTPPPVATQAAAAQQPAPAMAPAHAPAPATAAAPAADPAALPPWKQ